MCTDKFTFRKLSCNGTYTRVYFTDNENVSLWEKGWRHRTPYIARYPSLSRLERLIFIALGTSHRVFAPYYAENYIKKEGKGTFERRKIRKKIYFSMITKIDKLAIRSSDFVTGNKTVEDCSLFLLKSSPDDMIDNVIIVKKSWIHCYYGKEIKEGREKVNI